MPPAATRDSFTPGYQDLILQGKPYVLLPKGDFDRLTADAQAGKEDASRFQGKPVGPDLRSRRVKAGMTVAAVAQGARIRPETLSRIENGRTNPTISTVQAILAALG